MACGKPIMGDRVEQGLSVVYINFEDDNNEVWRRVLAILTQHGLTTDDLDINLIAVGVEATSEWSPLADDSGVSEIAIRGLKALIEIVRADILILDPWATAQHADENSNTAVNKIASRLAILAAETGAVIHAVHHVRKPLSGANVVSSMEARGASALRAKARVSRLITSVPDEKKREWGVGEDTPVIALIRDKSNYTITDRDRFRKLETVVFDNGDEVAVPVIFTPPDIIGEIGDEEWRDCTRILQQAEHDGHALRVWSGKGRPADDWAGNIILTHLGLPKETGPRSAINQRLEEWLENDVLGIQETKTTNRKEKKGYTVLVRLDYENVRV